MVRDRIADAVKLNRIAEIVMLNGIADVVMLSLSKHDTTSRMLRSSALSMPGHYEW